MNNDDWKDTFANAVFVFVVLACIGGCSYIESKMEIERLKIEKGIK
jgi:hypothetical protein